MQLMPEALYCLIQRFKLEEKVRVCKCWMEMLHKNAPNSLIWRLMTWKSGHIHRRKIMASSSSWFTARRFQRFLVSAISNRKDAQMHEYALISFSSCFRSSKECRWMSHLVRFNAFQFGLMNKSHGRTAPSTRLVSDSGQNWPLVWLLLIESENRAFRVNFSHICLFGEFAGAKMEFYMKWEGKVLPFKGANFFGQTLRFYPDGSFWLWAQLFAYRRQLLLYFA